MQSVFFLISVTTGCVNDLQSVLEGNKNVRGVWRVFSGEYDIIALVASDELGESGEELDQLIDFRESLGELSKEYYDEESEQWITRKFVHRVSPNLIAPGNSQHFAVLGDSLGVLPPQGEPR